MSNYQLELAIQMHENGVSWNVIANHFNVTPATLLKYRKLYDTKKQNN